jgi:hypothetical protein
MARLWGGKEHLQHFDGETFFENGDVEHGNGDAVLGR